MTGRDGLVWGPLDWQSRGQGFESPQLHVKPLFRALFSRFWVSRIWDYVHYRSTIEFGQAFDSEPSMLVSGLRCPRQVKRIEALCTPSAGSLMLSNGWRVVDRTGVGHTCWWAGSY